jgi:5'(3')-deoxyribonucleotidase
VRLAVDVDNVTVAWQEHWLDAYPLWFDREVDHTKLGLWRCHVEGTHFPSANQFFKWMEKAGLWDDIPYVPGAAGALWELQKHPHHSFIFCTARHEGRPQETARVLAEVWDAPIDFRNAQSKHLTKADLWVDDSPEVLASLLANGKPCIRFEQPWNVGVDATFHARDWHEVLEIVEEIG